MAAHQPTEWARERNRLGGNDFAWVTSTIAFDYRASNLNFVVHASEAHVTGETELHARIRRGDPEAFEQLFRTHYAALCRFALRYVESTGAAEEIAQELFARLWIDRARWPSPSNVRAYLLTAVRNRALNAVDRRRVEAAWAAEELVQGDPIAPDDALGRLEDAETREVLNRALDALPTRCRLAMELRWTDEMSYADIAGVMGISIKGVEHLLARGLRSVREYFRGRV